MNDFTKEDLICMRDNIVVPMSNHDKNILFIAYQKLLGMIDNYCEHENIITYSSGIECLNCKRKWEC